MTSNLQRNEEINKKIEMIKAIRMLSSCKARPRKEFDETETMNIGLLCEMSLAEVIIGLNNTE